MSTPEPAPIPVRLAGRPTIGGLVVPWVTGRAPDGRYRFGAIDAHRHDRAIHHRRCQTCGGPLDQDRIVFALRDDDLHRLISPEGGMHPECGRYSASACPMLAGRMSHHRATPPLAGLAHLGVVSLGDPPPRPCRRTRPAVAPRLGQRLPGHHRPGHRHGRRAALPAAPAPRPAHRHHPRKE